MKYVLDTNTISVLENVPYHPAIAQKINAHQYQIAITAVTWHELWYGYHRLPPSQRKERVRNFLHDVEQLQLPILPYDEAAALWFAEERARLSLRGKTPAHADGQIAAITAVNHLILITRNTPDFTAFHTLPLENWFI